MRFKTLSVLFFWTAFSLFVAGLASVVICSFGYGPKEFKELAEVIASVSAFVVVGYTFMSAIENEI